MLAKVRTAAVSTCSAGNGPLLVFISHKLHEVQAISDRVTVLRDGSYVGTCAMDGVSTETLIQMMVGRTLDELYPKQEVELGEVKKDGKSIYFPGAVKSARTRA